MDSNSSSYLLNPSTIQSVYYHHHHHHNQAKEDHDGVIDLGLSLRTLEPEAYNPSGHLVNLEGYEDLIDWPQSHMSIKSKIEERSNNLTQDQCNEEEDNEGIQTKEKWAYVKVNMDGLIVGRKVCIVHHGSYSTLALQLEDMFGRQSLSGLRLFQAGSEFSLFYKDRHEIWRNVGDVPWKEFVECVKRLRIARKI